MMLTVIPPHTPGDESSGVHSNEDERGGAYEKDHHYNDGHIPFRGRVDEVGCDPMRRLQRWSIIWIDLRHIVERETVSSG